MASSPAASFFQPALYASEKQDERQDVVECMAECRCVGIAVDRRNECRKEERNSAAAAAACCIKQGEEDPLPRRDRKKNTFKCYADTSLQYSFFTHRNGG